MDAIETIKWLLETLVLLADIGIALFIFHVLFYRKGFFYDAYRENKSTLLWMAFAIALISTMGSLFYSEIVGWTPCKLCWYQRIFMYPLVIILGIAALRKDSKIGIYALPMAAIGGLIAAFHYGEQISATIAALTNCAAEGVECSARYTLGYGYMTIPIMALTGFIAIGILVYLKRKHG